MKSTYKTIAGILFFLIPIIIFSQDAADILLQDIVKNLEKYKGKTITLKLKLRNFDTIFDKIIFYDKKNHDIEFDISTKEKKKRIKSDMLNIHEGMNYYVTFTVQDVGNLGGLIGDLHAFKPVILSIFPENIRKDKIKKAE